MCQDLEVYLGVSEAEACNFIKKGVWHGCFPMNFAKVLRTPFSQNLSGRLLLGVSEVYLRNISDGAILSKLFLQKT